MVAKKTKKIAKPAASKAAPVAKGKIACDCGCGSCCSRTSRVLKAVLYMAVGAIICCAFCCKVRKHHHHDREGFLTEKCAAMEAKKAGK